MGDQKPHILVVEDEVPILEVLRGLFEMEGMSFAGATRPDLALESALTEHPDLMLIDVMLSGASGIEVAARLRDSACAATPLIAASASPLMLSFAEQTGLFDACLSKPFELDSLLDTVQALIAKGTSRAG